MAPARPTQFNLLTHAPMHQYPAQKPESHAVTMSISEAGLKTLGGVPRSVQPDPL
jgi:hypothetical protein